MITAFVGRGQAFNDVGGRHALGKIVQARRGIQRVEQRLRGERAHTTASMRAQCTHGKKFAGYRHAKRTR
jgi:hypothetical protein